MPRAPGAPLFLILCLTLACESGDGVATGAIQVSWRVERGGATITCDDAAGVWVTAHYASREGSAHRDETFVCADLEGLRDGLAPGTWDVTLRLLDADGVELSTADASLVDVAAGETTQVPTVVLSVP